MTAVGAAARYWLADGMAYFSNRPPDLGLTNAFDALGFDVQENTLDENTAPPLATLRRFREKAPVLIGPLDMQHLTYLPRHRDTPGADHYAVVTDADSEGVRLHDPRGYPNVRLSEADLRKAWRASGITYARGAFRHWRLPRRREVVDDGALVERCIDAFRQAYAWIDEPRWSNVATGSRAFELAAERLVAEDGGGALADLLTGFGLPLGARRAHDLAVFLSNRKPRLSALKRSQAFAFIDAYRSLADGDRTIAADAILRIGELDTRFRDALAAPA